MYELIALDKRNHFSLRTNDKHRALVVVSKEGRKNSYRLHLGRGNWTDIVGKPEFDSFVKENWNGKAS